jgi:hypothetical protein
MDLLGLFFRRHGRSLSNTKYYSGSAVHSFFWQAFVLWLLAQARCIARHRAKNVAMDFRFDDGVERPGFFPASARLNAARWDVIASNRTRPSA